VSDAPNSASVLVNLDRLHHAQLLVVHHVTVQQDLIHGGTLPLADLTLSVAAISRAGLGLNLVLNWFSISVSSENLPRRAIVLRALLLAATRRPHSGVPRADT
jgi:hypothetical protein